MDDFVFARKTVSNPARHIRAITPSDTADLQDIPKAIYVGTGGDVALIGVDAAANATGVVWKNVQAGTVLPISPRRILATGTTATDLVALYSGGTGYATLTPATASVLGPNTATFDNSLAQGSTILSATGLQDGEGLADISPNDGRVAVGGLGKTLVVGRTAFAAGTFNFTVYTSVGRSFTVAVTVTATSGTPSVDAKRVSTLAKLRRVMTAAQVNNPQDVAPLGLIPTFVGAGSTLPNEYTMQNTPGVFEVLGGVAQVTTDPAYYVIVDSDATPQTSTLSSVLPSGLNYYQHYGVWNFKLTNGRYLELGFREISNGIRLYVNGRMVNPGRVSHGSDGGVVGLNWVRYDLGAVGTYEIGVEVSGAPRFRGVRVEAGATVSKPARSDTGTMLVIGDSYTQGVISATNTRGESFMQGLGRYLGMKNTITAGLSGMSYTIGANSDDQSAAGVKKAPYFYSDFVKPKLGGLDPDIVLVALGYNDNTSSGPPAAAALALWQQLRADFPRALIINLGIYTPNNQVLASLQNREAAFLANFVAWADPHSIFIRQAMAAGGADALRWMYGTGKSGTPKLDGVNDYVILSDSIHLTDGYDQLNGQWYVGARLRDAIISGINLLPATYNPSNTQIPVWPLTLKGAAATVPAATVGSPYLFATMATGGRCLAGTGPHAGSIIPTRAFSIVSGTIPPGLTLQTTAGHLTGTPTTAGTYTFTLRVTDGVTSVDLPVTIVVS